MYQICMYACITLNASAFISMWLLHILSTREQSNTADSNKFGCFSCGFNTQCVPLRDGSLLCAKELGIFSGFS